MEKIKGNLKKIIASKLFIASIFIILTSLIMSIPLLFLDSNIQIDDGIQHICRLIGTEQSIEEGQLMPVIMSNFCNEFGYSWNLFYSPLTSYLPLIFRIFTSSYEMCLRLFILLVNFVSGYAMYFFMKKFLKGKFSDKKIEAIAILASILYLLFPYRLNDMYVRVAVPELTSFIFIPLVFNGLYSIVNLKEKSYLLTIGSVGMLLTHSLLTIYLVIFCIIYLIVNYKEINKKVIINLLINAAIILLITSFYWIPLLESKLSADYEVFNENHMIRWDVMKMLKVNPIELLIYEPGRMFYGLGFVTIVGVVLSFFTFRKVKDLKNYLFFLIVGIISVIMTLNCFPFEKLPSIFTMMQFSFRMLEFGGFFLIVIASTAIGINFEKYNIYTTLCLLCISVLTLIPNLSGLEYGSYISEEDLINGIRVTSSTGRVHAGCASFEYLPSKAFKNRKYIEERSNLPIILNANNIEIKDFNKNGTNCSFHIESSENDAKELQVELPYIYYIGYNVEYVDDSGDVHKIDNYESDNGFVCVNVPNNNITINVKYTGTILMKIAYAISILSVCILLGIFVIKKFVNRK